LLIAFDCRVLARHLPRGARGVLDRTAVHELPDLRVKALELPLNRQKCNSVLYGDHSKHFFSRSLRSLQCVDQLAAIPADRLQVLDFVCASVRPVLAVMNLQPPCPATPRTSPSSYDQSIFGLYSEKGIPPEDVVRYGLPDRRSAQAYLRHLLSSAHTADAVSTWTWIASRGWADDRVEPKYSCDTAVVFEQPAEPSSAQDRSSRPTAALLFSGKQQDVALALVIETRLAWRHTFTRTITEESKSLQVSWLKESSCPDLRQKGKLSGGCFCRCRLPTMLR
jgi:hypothetical protein